MALKIKIASDQLPKPLWCYPEYLQPRGRSMMKIGDLEKILGKLQTAVKKAKDIKLDSKSASDLQTLTSKLAKEAEKS